MPGIMIGLRWMQLIKTNSPQHQHVENRRGYLQYGLPTGTLEEEFEVVEMAGRIYARHFAEKSLTIGLYIIAPDFEILEQIDRDYLQKQR